MPEDMLPTHKSVHPAKKSRIIKNNPFTIVVEPIAMPPPRKTIKTHQEELWGPRGPIPASLTYNPVQKKRADDRDVPLTLNHLDFVRALGEITLPDVSWSSLSSRPWYSRKDRLSKKNFPQPAHLNVVLQKLLWIEQSSEWKDVQEDKNSIFSEMLPKSQDVSTLLDDPTQVFKLYLGAHQNSHKGDNVKLEKRGTDYRANDKMITGYPVQKILQDIDHYNTIVLCKKCDRQLSLVGVCAGERHGEAIKMDLKKTADVRDEVYIMAGKIALDTIEDEFLQYKINRENADENLIQEMYAAQARRLTSINTKDDDEQVAPSGGLVIPFESGMGRIAHIMS